MLVLSRKGKEDCSELLTVLAVILKENYLLDPCVASSTRSGVPFFLGQNLREGQRLQNGRLHCGGAPENKSGALNADESPSPSTGLGSWGKMLQRTQLWKGRRKPKEKEKKKKKSPNLFQLQYRNKIILMNDPADLICIHLHLIFIPRGIRARVRVRFLQDHNSPGTSCHGNLLFTRLLIGQEFQLIFSHCFPDFDAVFLVSKCNSTFLMVKLYSFNSRKLELYFATSRTLHHEQWKILKVTLTLMRNNVLFLSIHKHIPTHRKYGKPDEDKSWKQHYSGANR